MEEQTSVGQEHDESFAEQAKVWLQENLRVIVSLFIVAAIALGIYSYSQRPNTATNMGTDTETTASTEGAKTDTNSILASTPATQSALEQSRVLAPTELSSESETAFTEIAMAGDGATHLARRAMFKYLAQHSELNLTNEHRVFIEDYLQKHVARSSSLAIGSSLEFSKDLLQQAVSAAQQLSPAQLTNLKRWSQKVAAYRS